MSGASQHEWQIHEVFSAPELEQVWLKRSHAALHAGAMPFWGNAGWAKFTRKVVRTDTEFREPAELGALLFAEWVDRQGHSFRIDADPQVPGQLAIFTLEEVQELSSGSTPVWREEVVIDGDGAAAGRLLNYSVYIAERDDGEMYRLCDAFRGWGTI